jgi:hypothetical protein
VGHRSRHQSPESWKEPIWLGVVETGAPHLSEGWWARSEFLVCSLRTHHVSELYMAGAEQRSC